MSTEQLSHTQIKINGGTQMRAGTNHDTVGAYADIMRHNNSYDPFPPIIVYFDGADYWLGDGFHRHAAAFQAFGSACAIPAEVRAGTRRDAVLHAAGANAEHGLQRTPQDKRRAVQALLLDDEWRTWSNYKVADACRVSEAFVRKIKGELNIETTHETQYIHPRTGQPATMNTQKIGQVGDDAKLDREIIRLSRWLIERGWGINYAPMPSPCYVMKGDIRLLFAHREDKKGELSALQNAKAHEEAETQTVAAQHTPSHPSSTSLDPLANDERIQIMDQLAAEIKALTSPTPASDPVEAAQAITETLDEAVRRAWAIPEKAGAQSPATQSDDDEPGPLCSVIGCYQSAVAKRGDGSPLCACHVDGTEDSAGEAAAEPLAPSTPIRETSRALLSGSVDDRLFLAKSLLNTISVALDDLPVYSTLTGKFTEILPAERSLKLMRDELRRLIESLSPKRIA